MLRLDAGVPIVVDTNVLVPSIYSETFFYHILSFCDFTLLWNEFTRSEAHEIIDRLALNYTNKFDVKLCTESHETLDLLLCHENKVPEMPADWQNYSPDRDDDNFLWVALRGGAKYIITYNQSDLLNLQTFKGIPIGKPHDFKHWAEELYVKYQAR